MEALGKRVLISQTLKNVSPEETSGKCLMTSKRKTGTVNLRKRERYPLPEVPISRGQEARSVGAGIRRDRGTPRRACASCLERKDILVTSST